MKTVEVRIDCEYDNISIDSCDLFIPDEYEKKYLTVKIFVDGKSVEWNI